MMFLRAFRFGCILLAVFPMVGPSHGAITRVGAPSLRLPNAPISYGYVLVNTLGNLPFLSPIVLRTPPGETNRLFVLEQDGRLIVVTNLASPTRTVFLDITNRVAGGTPTDERGLLGLAFHPGYATNGYFFLYYSLTVTNATNAALTRLYQRLSRWRVSSTDPNVADPDSETPLLTMFDEALNHNGGDLHFGPDGLLYVSLGDEGAANDSFNNSQRIDKDFWSSMLRLDVDEPFRPDSLAPNPHPANTNGLGEIQYRIPADNPFVGASSFLGLPVDPSAVRTEMYAVGLRNPWRFAFDAATGLLYCGDVGQGAWEEIDIINKGGNYGWAYREGFLAGPKIPPPGFTSAPPILAYGHGSGTNQGFSVTGGVVYRGQGIPALHGYYIFADYVSGNVWATYYNGSTATNFFRLLGETGIAAFGVDPSNGDVLACDQNDGRIKRLVFQAVSGQPLPESLVDTGVFSDLATLSPSAGLVPYDVNVPFWSDHALKTRWFHIPTNSTLIFQPLANWQFPTGSVWVKHFEMEMTNGVPASRRRLETRLLVKYTTASVPGVYGATYRWDETGTNAFLVPEGGLDEELTVDDGGQLRAQSYHYPGRAECVVCHSAVSGGVLGFHTFQLNRDFDYDGVTANQLQAMSDAGYFLRPLTNLYTLRALARADDESVSVEQRVRSYLVVNCSPCHQPGGAGLGSFDTRLTTTLTSTRLIDGGLINNGGDTEARLVVRGSLEHSMLRQRLARRGPGQMPPLGSTVVDDAGVALLSRWLTNELPSYQTFSEWQIAQFGSAATPEAQALVDPDGDGANNFTEYLTRTSPTNAVESWGLALSQEQSGVTLRYRRLVNRRVEVQWSTNPADATSWQFLYLPENRPLIPANDGTHQLSDELRSDFGKYYRARLSEP
jgi:uncharacterized repeat protein (TIGR03806 family)